MNPVVEEYLEKVKSKESEKEEQARKKTDEEYKAYRDKVIKKAGLVEKGIVEVSRETYDFGPYIQIKIEKDENKQKHYFVEGKVPIELTDEEFAEVEKTFTPEELAKCRNVTKAPEKAPEASSWAANFCNVIAWFLFIGGFILAIIAGTATKEFSFSAFLTTMAIYIVAGCFALCMRELFDHLQKIVLLLQEKKS